MKPTIFIGCSTFTEYMATILKNELASIANIIVMPQGQDYLWRSDLFNEKTLPDIVVYIFDADGAATGSAASVWLKEKNSCYNAGLLTGRMGYGNTFLLIPANETSPQWAFEGKKYKEVLYNPKEIHAEKMLLPFCKELRVLIKEQQWLLDNNLKDLPEAAQKVALKKEAYWEQVFFCQLFTSQVKDIKAYYDALDLPFVTKQCKEAPGEEIIDWVNSKMEDYEYIVHRLSYCLGSDFRIAIGPRGVNGKPILIKQCSLNASLSIDRLYNWQLGCKAAIILPEYEYIRTLMLKLSDKVLQYMVAYPQKMMQHASLHRLGIPERRLKLTLDTGKLLREIEKAVEQLKLVTGRGEFSMN